MHQQLEWLNQQAISQATYAAMIDDIDETILGMVSGKIGQSNTPASHLCKDPDFSLYCPFTQIVKDHIERTQHAFDNASSSPEAARSFLVRAGILDSS